MPHLHFMCTCQMPFVQSASLSCGNKMDWNYWREDSISTVVPTTSTYDFVVQHSKTGDITFKASLIDNERFHNAAHLLCLLELLVNEKSLHLYQG